jgi:NAD(P)-dependent dehydrogenase (short-subunit alcohol dehydrogenase family)
VSLPDRVLAADHTADPLNGMLDFTGRVAVVTGAASGIGRACALRLAEAGAHVYGADLAYKDPAEPADQHSIEPVGLDVTDSAEVEALVSRVTEKHGRLDIWVHAAGILPRADVLDLSLAEWRRVIETNLDGTFLCAQAAGRAMVKGAPRAQAKGGVIVTLASTVAYRVNSNAAHYRATKAGVLALTQNLAIELAPHGVRALAVCPTLTLTEGALQLNAPGLERYAARLPLGRAAYPDDVARVVVFAASPLAAYMTGSALLVDGGEMQQ